MSDIRYKNIRIIEGGIVKYKKVEITVEDIITEKEEEIKHLKVLVDSLRSKLEVYEQQEQRQKLIEAGPAESYSMYD
jgi:hypothetical protein